MIILDLRPGSSFRASRGCSRERANGSGFFGGETGGAGWLFYVLPFGALLLTQYTITGFDACAHLSEETR